jgi:hypothetical protein
LVVGLAVASVSNIGTSGVASASGFIVSHWGDGGKKDQEENLSIVVVDGAKQ